MRVDPEQEVFASASLNWEMDIFLKTLLNEIELKLFLRTISSGNLIEDVFGECSSKQSFNLMKDRVILASINKEVNTKNAKMSITSHKNANRMKIMIL